MSNSHRGIQRETSPPSAPPLAPLLADKAASSSSGSPYSSGGGVGGSQQALEHQGMYQDLLRRANGDHQLAALWLAEMGFPAAEFQQQQQQASIKAVGTNSGRGLAAWGSLAANRSSPAVAKTTLGSAGVGAAAAAAPAGDKNLDAQAAEAGAPRHFFCPISMSIMRDPVMLPTGQTYDRPCIERWLQQGQTSCPATGQALATPVHLVPNVALRNSIEEWAEKHTPWLLDRNRRVKPIPKEEQLGAMPPAAGAADPDLAYAVHLQQVELSRIASQRSGVGGSAPGGPPAGAGAAVPSAFAASAMLAATQQQRGLPLAGAGSMRHSASGARQQQRRGCINLTSLFLFGITAAYIALFVVSLWKSGWHITNLALNPFAGASQAALLEAGAQDAQRVASTQWWRLFTSPFVNAGVIQMLLNMTCLFTFGRYLEAAMLYPLPCIASTYLVGAWVGALASANLNFYYVTCGASAGVCALLGAVWADQAINRRKYASQPWTCIVLAIITAIFITMSLLPLLDPWYQAAALLTGFFWGLALLMLPRVGRGRRRGAGRWLAAQSLCAFLVIGAATVAVVGVVLDGNVGTKAGFLRDGSCVEFGWWQCLPAGSSPNGCAVEARPDAAPLLYCPAGTPVELPNGTTLGSGDVDLITQLCFQYCATADTGGGSSGGDSGGASSPSPGGDNWGTNPGSSPVPPAKQPPAAAGSGGGTSGGSGVLLSVGPRN